MMKKYDEQNFIKLSVSVPLFIYLKYRPSLKDV